VRWLRFLFPEQIIQPEVNPSMTGRRLPPNWEHYVFVRSYAQIINDQVWRVEVRKDPHSNHIVKVGTPMPAASPPRKGEGTPLTVPMPRARPAGTGAN
jgi:hypothetical protein